MNAARKTPPPSTPGRTGPKDTSALCSHPHALTIGSTAGDAEDCDNASILFWIKACVFIDMFGVALVVPLLTTYFR